MRLSHFLFEFYKSLVTQTSHLPTLRAVQTLKTISDTHRSSAPTLRQASPLGLSSAEAASRLAHDGPNLLPGNAPKTTAAIVRLRRR